MFGKIRDWIKRNQLLVFILIAFIYSWSLSILAAVFIPEKIQGSLLYTPTIYGPTLAAVLLPLLTGGFKGLADFLKTRLFQKGKAIWYLVGLFGIPILLITLRAIHLMIFPDIDLGPFEIDRSWTQILSGFLMMLPFGPLGEELGWRGFAVPMLQKKMNALSASLVLGLIWWVWHFPQLLIPELQWVVGGMPVMIYLLMIMPGSILASWIVNNTNGNVIPVILFHTSMNYFTGLLVFNSPYAFPMIMAGLWAAVILVVLLSGPDLKRRQGSAPELKYIEQL